MRSFLHHNFCRSVKWLSSFCQKKNTLERTPITAEKLQEICNPFHSSLKEDSKSRFRRALTCIKASGLEKNIILKVASDSSSGELEISFSNLKIEGDIKINFSALKEIKFVNSIFSDNVKINILGAIDTSITFNGNEFSKNFDLNAIDVNLITIENNDIPHKMSMCATFTPLSNDADHSRTKQRFGGIQLTELFMVFSKNTINHLHICDVNNPSDWDKRGHDYPLEEITFDGNNCIRILEINTKHTTLIPNMKLKADINRIFFKASDKMEISTLETDPTSDQDNMHSLIYKQYPLIYGKFFSLLEAQAFEQNDHENGDMYKRKARYFYRTFLPKWQDKLIFYWTNLISRDGTSWARPIICLVLIEMILAAIAWYFLILIQWDLYYSWQEGGKVFLTLLTWFMNPASLLPLPVTLDPKTIANSWLIYLLFLLQKASVAAFYYEIIKVLRRFTK